jgi:SAM-dependent methyltransferase
MEQARSAVETRDAPREHEYQELVEYFDGFAAAEPQWRSRNRTYHRLIESVCRFSISPGARVLEIGCGSGDLLAALKPSLGVGVDISSAMIEIARSRHPELQFVVAAGEDLELGTASFDYIVLSDLLPYVEDLVALFERLARYSHPDTRIVINSDSQLWRPVIWLAELLRMKPRLPVRNWVSPDDVVNILQLTGFEAVTLTRRILMPKEVPLVTSFLNGIVGSIWPLTHLCLTWWIVARPREVAPHELSVSVVCPCRNEEGNVAAIVDRLPTMGTSTELIFVEGDSSDGTRDEIQRQIQRHPDRDISLVVQPGRGKGDAVRAGFAAAKNDVLMILDGDLTVRPEDLPKFYRALADRRGELINGSRLVYDLEPGAMQFLNLVANRIFSLLLAAIVGQHMKDTLCGTKVLRRDDYERIASRRADLGDTDPFGDFDLLFGAGRLGLKILDLPVRYAARTYGRTNISRFRNGLHLLRMTAAAFRLFRVSIYRHATR